MLEDDELAELLADEDRVRDALLAAVDVQQVPPVKTDLAEIVHRGRRRARMQVLAASVTAVAVIAGIAVGATALGRLAGPGKVSTAAGQPPLTVTSQLAPPTPTMTAESGLCVFPELVDGNGAKSLPATVVQQQIFFTEVRAMAADAQVTVVQVNDSTLAEKTGPGSFGVRIMAAASDQLDSTVTLQRGVFAGAPAEAAITDVKQYEEPAQNCGGKVEQLDLGNGMVANLYTEGVEGGSTYQRVRLYTQQGERYDVTELTDAAGVPPTSVIGKPTATGASTYRTVGPLVADQLISVALQVAARSG
ncbi:MAG TPA: hypothetical protein VHX38_36440 [Pseudonocardiaceae bacterium]|jgi:hypothetical protein|nr:hypothetical protein [Pseudonocardiaceae bacterium]